MNTTAQSLIHLALIALVPAAIAAIAISCCPAKAQGPIGSSQVSLSGDREHRFMIMCLAGRSTLFNHRGHGKHASVSVRMEYPDERLEYCAAQIKNYRSLTP